MTPLQTDARVADAAMEGPYRRIQIHAPGLAARMSPGQFVTVDVGGTLRQPLLPAAVGAERLDFLLLPDHPGAAVAPGQAVNLLGPLGRPFRLPPPPARLLLFADDQRLPALLPAAHRALDAGCPATLLLTASTAAALYPLSLLPPALEVHLVTADGSVGHTGSPLEVLAQLEAAPGPAPYKDGGQTHRRGQALSLLLWADCLLAATDPSLYPALAEVLRTVRLRPRSDFAQALLLPTVVCGVGACQGCAVSTRRGFRRACTDGPAFDLLELA